MVKKRTAIALFSILLALAFTVPTALAEQYTLMGKPLNLFGYITQGVAYSAKTKDNYDSERGVNSLLTNVFVEAGYEQSKDLKFYLSGMFTGDWIYDVKNHEQEWMSKQFDKSRKYLYTDTEYWQLLKEAHVTWSPQNFQFRVGKQIVAWGETDGFRLMDQINPVDGRRGFADVEFENTIIPTWLIKGEYFPKIQSSWMQDLAFEGIFSPNATFIPNQAIWPGNDRAGIWAPNVRLSGDIAAQYVGFPPGVNPGAIQVGSANRFDIDKPNSFDSKGFEYGFRVKSIVWDTNVTLNYHYGLDKSPTVWNPSNAGPDMSAYPQSATTPDGRWLFHPNFKGRYDLFRFAGGTLSRDIPWLKSSALGGVAPVVRLEAFYLFGNTLATTIVSENAQLQKTDEVRWALGMDWKVKIPWLNPAQGITISPQFYMRSILDYPQVYGNFGQPPFQQGRYLVDHGSMALLDRNNYMTTLMMFTSYWNSKLTPSVFWMHDVNRRADFYRFQLVYDYSNKWHYTAGAIFLGGKDHMNNGVMNNSFEFFDNKDYFYFKVSYKWG
jgi:hypothetical protein